MRELTNQELVKIGAKVNDAVRAVWKKGPTVEEMENLKDYIQEQETILPLTDPIFIQQNGFKLFNQAKERIELLRPIIELKQKEEDNEPK